MLQCGNMRSLAMCAILLTLASCFKTESFRIQQYQNERILNGELPANQALADFIFGDFHGLTTQTMQTNAVPFKLAMTALLLRESKKNGVIIDQTSLPALFQQWGFFIAKDPVQGWNEAEDFIRDELMPIGFVRGELLGREGNERIEIMNINCSTCHTGTGYNESGEATLVHTPGLPNTSINIDLFLNSIFDALITYSTDKEFRNSVLINISNVFKDVDKRELRTIRMMNPILISSIKKLARKFNGFSPVSFGGAGLSNAVALFKDKMKSRKFDAKDEAEASYVSIPALYSTGFRSSLLVDGATGPTGEEFFKEMKVEDLTEEHYEKLAKSAVYFPMLVSGASEKNSIKSIPKIKKAIKYFTKVEKPKFPGSIDKELANNGKIVYENQCMKCHGQYEGPLDNLVLTKYPNKLVPQNIIGTDDMRVKNLDENLVKAMKKSRFAEYFEGKQTNGYVAPILDSLWATAPYLHNGSVPTLWHLMNPELRPKKFMVGGHKLNFELVGIDGELNGEIYQYIDDYAPWSRPTLYDTSKLGMKNTGHEFPFNRISHDEKIALIEFLKLL